jgi:hypothetical protein
MVRKRGEWGQVVDPALPRERKHMKAMYAIMAFGLIALLTGCGRSYLSADKVEVRSEQASPSGNFIATSFHCEGGGAAGYVYDNVSLRRAGETLDQRDVLLGKHTTWSGFSNIDLRWIDDRNLEISYSKDTALAYRDHVSVRVDSKYGITIHYIVRQ